VRRVEVLAVQSLWPVRGGSDRIRETIWELEQLLSVEQAGAWKPARAAYEYAAEACGVRTHERVTITRHGHTAAVLISAEDLAALEETVDILATPGAVDAIAEGLADLAAGRLADNEELRARFAAG